MIGATPLTAQTDPSPSVDVRFAAHAFFSNIAGMSLVEGTSISIGDSTLQTGLDIRAKARRRQWSLAGEFRMADAGTPSGSSAATAGPARLKIREIELYGGYRLGEPDASHTLDALLGGRYVQHRYAPERDDARTIAAEWLEPFAGLRFASSLGAGFWFAASGNIGGWGLGSSFTWVIEGELGRQVTRRVGFISRYRYSEAEFEEAGRYEWDSGQLQGWLFGMEIAL